MRLHSIHGCDYSIAAGLLCAININPAHNTAEQMFEFLTVVLQFRLYVKLVE
jgi:hypothetical protein